MKFSTESRSQLKKNQKESKKKTVVEAPKSLTSLKETNYNNAKYLIIPPKEKFLFLFSFAKRFLDKSILVYFSTKEQVNVIFLISFTFCF